MTLWDFQREAVNRAIARAGVYNLFFEMGCGKTRTAIVAAQRLHAEPILVVIPISAAGVWRNEIAQVWPDAHVVTLVDGLIRDRAQTVLRYLHDPHRPKPLFVLVNYEAFWREPLRSALRKVKFQLLIYDEVHRLKHKATKQSRFAHQMADETPMRLGLTGSPMTHGPEDLYSTYRAVDPTVFGLRWSDFQAQYIHMGGYLNREIVGYRNQDEIERKLQESSFRITKAEALSLPEELDVRVPVRLGPRNQNTYDRLKREAIASIDTKDEDGNPISKTVLARIVLTSILRLQQITSGFVKTVSEEEGTLPSEGEIVDIGTEKLDVLADTLADVDGRAVVFCRFTHDVDRVRERIKAMGRNVYVLDGRVSSYEREQRLLRWREDATGVIVGQIQVTALAMDFTAASVAFFYSLDFNLVNYIQSRARLHRHGQRNPVTYYHLVAEGTVDEKIYATLAKREELAKTILDDPRQVFESTHDEVPVMELEIA